MSLTLYEQETIIRFDEESGDAELYTASGRVIGHLTRAGLEPYKVEGPGHFYKMPKESVRVRPPGCSMIRIGGTSRPGKVASESPGDDNDRGVEGKLTG